ncbi:DUF5991 domain-containing protein [Fulvivirga sediminis]|uniref:Uncharacterized protein n=1 Tax=Fulvivirga sediminis TaxID=2803949 RepID=A0A937K3H7_9BACT|nr:DUF5991 domain-containing protein [Fulvivirga sediminis]MBL3658992.1 hypothetical protein [Fulvivirga sediminis]
MLKLNYFFLIYLFPILLSCNTTVKETQERPNEINDIQNNYSEVVEDFYSWYLNQYYNKKNKNPFIPKYQKTGNGKIGLNVSDYSSRLDQVPHLSESFKESLIKKCKECNNLMLESLELNSFDPEYDADFYLGKNKDYKCDFLRKDIILGGQGEAVTAIKINEVEITKVDNQRLVHAYSLIDNSIFSYLDILVENNENGDYKIDSISVFFNKPKSNIKNNYSFNRSDWIGKYHLTQDKGKIDEFSSIVIGYQINITKDSSLFIGQGYQTNFIDLCSIKKDGDTLKLYYDSTLEGTNYNETEDSPLLKLYKKQNRYYVTSPVISVNTNNNSEIEFEKFE